MGIHSNPTIKHRSSTSENWDSTLSTDMGPSHYTSFAGCETEATNALDERGDIFGGQNVIKVVFLKKTANSTAHFAG